MMNFTADQIGKIMANTHNIRHVTLISNVDPDEGRSTLWESLVNKAGVNVATDPANEEQDKDVTQNVFSLYHEVAEEDMVFISSQQTKGNQFLVNLINTSQDLDFPAEVSSALRITDGVLVTVDCLKGVTVQVETRLRQAICDRVKPVLFMTNMERALLELDLDQEDLYQTFQRVIESTNVIIATYIEDDGPMGNTQVDPCSGTVAFGSQIQGWAFSLKEFAEIYAAKFKIEPIKLMKRFWGDNFFHPKDKKWSKIDVEGAERGFNTFCLDPIYKLFQFCMSNSKENVNKMLEKLNIKLTSEELELEDKALLKVVMSRWLPLDVSLLNMVVIHLPSPVTAQAYRAEILYEGPTDDECFLGIKECNPEAPLMMYVSKMIPSKDETGFYPFGRVFSGRVSTGQKVTIMTSNKDADRGRSIEGTLALAGPDMELIESVPCGNLCGLVGMTQYMVTYGTVTSQEEGFPIRGIKFSTSPLMSVSVDCKDPSELPKLLEGLKRLSKKYTFVECNTEETGSHTIGAASEAHVDACVNDLKMYTGIDLEVSNPVVPHRETVKEASSNTCMARSPNNDNSIFMSAAPIPEDFAMAIDVGDFNPRQDSQNRAEYMAEKFDFDAGEARNIWCFGPSNSGPNLFIDGSNGVEHLDEIKDSLVAGFQWATKEGVLCGEKMRGVKFNLHDVTLHADAIHRGGEQIIPTTRRAIYASFLAASPAIFEPFYLVEIQYPKGAECGVNSALSGRRCTDLERNYGMGAIMWEKVYMPVSESFGLLEEMRSTIQDKVIPYFTFDHWQILHGDLEDPESLVARFVASTRERKGLPEGIPSVDTFLDNL